nr:PREDICTED: T-cell antigen CD7 isoform X2 [Anolis carolinensis]|eukprot:XP_008102560.1 PREDICTED: T-cell antigen CD7 isoform X2 [Anolis carolinensis]
MSWSLALYFLICFSGTSATKENTVKHELIVIIAEEGDSVNMTCDFNNPKLIGVYLKRILGNPMNVIYATAYGKDKTEAPEYKNRTEYFQLNNTVMITLRQVKKNDSDAYVCEGALLRNNLPHTMNSSSIILAVKEKTEYSSSPWMLYTLIFLSLLVVFILGCFSLSHINVKKYCKKEKGQELQNIVYEDMTCSLRPNTKTTSNVYSAQ